MQVDNTKPAVSPLCPSTHKHVRVLKVVSPVRPDLPLASDVPHVQFETLRLDALDIEALVWTQKHSV